jgi:ribosomal protein L34E
MDHVGAILGGFALLGITVDGLLRKFEKKAQKFPYCRTCGNNMLTAGLPKFMPGEVLKHLDEHNLPTGAAARFICPKGHYQLWFIPKLGNTEKAFFLREEL